MLPVLMVDISSVIVIDVSFHISTSLIGIFPGRGGVIWRDWYTHDVVTTIPGAKTTLPAPLGHINVHVRDGSAILLHARPAYTIEETRRGPFSLLVSQAGDGKAFGTAFLDDGISDPPGLNKTLTFSVSAGRLEIHAQGFFDVKQKLQDVTVLGAEQPKEVVFQGQRIKNWVYAEAQGKLVMRNINADLNGPAILAWK